MGIEEVKRRVSRQYLGNNDILETKRDISRRFLGENGVHGIGVSGETIRVYYKTNGSSEQTGTLEAIKTASGEFAVEFIESEPPQFL